MIAFDTETYLFNGTGNLTPRMVCASAHDGKETSLLLAKDAKPMFLRALKEGIVGANIAYDLGVAAAYWPDTLPLIFEAQDRDKVYDVQLLEALYANTTNHFFLNPETLQPLEHGYSLASLETLHLGIDRQAQKDGGWRLRYAELDGVPLEKWPSEAVEYSRADAEGTFKVFEKQIGRANYNCIHDEARSAFALHLMASWGIRTDPAYVEKVNCDIRTLHEASRKRFLGEGLVKLRRAKGGKEPEVPDLTVAGKGMKYQTDTKVVAARVEKAYQGRPPMTPTGRVECSRDTLLNSGDELLEAFGATGANEKLYSTYVAYLELGTRVGINARYRNLLTTGRTSCSGPNLQNLPRKGPIREAFVPRPGWVFASVDYATQELVTLAQVQLNWFKHSALADAINAEQDVHIRMAARFAGSNYEDFFARRKTPEVKKLRQAAKPANFGLPGLMGAPRLVLTARSQYDVRFCEHVDGGKCIDHPRLTVWKARTIAPTCQRCLELAVKIIEAWHAEWPEMRDYLSVCTRLVKEEQLIPLAGNGMELWTDNGGTACNAQFQGLAAQASKRALYEVCRQSYIGPGILHGNCRPVVFLHDEILAEVREEVAGECADEIAKVMVSAMRKYTPDVLVKAEPCLMRRWFKGAEMRRDAAGKLVPDWPDGWAWEPDQEQMRKDKERL